MNQVETKQLQRQLGEWLVLGGRSTALSRHIAGFGLLHSLGISKETASRHLFYGSDFDAPISSHEDFSACVNLFQSAPKLLDYVAEITDFAPQYRPILALYKPLWSVYTQANNRLKDKAGVYFEGLLEKINDDYEMWVMHEMPINPNVIDDWLASNPAP